MIGSRLAIVLALVYVWGGLAQAQEDASLCFGGVCAPRLAIQHLGEFCWHVFEAGSDHSHDTGIPEDETILRLGVSHMGNGNFALQGTLKTGEAEPIAVNGNAKLASGAMMVGTLTGAFGQLGATLETQPPQVADIAGAQLLSLSMNHDSLEGTAHLSTATAVNGLPNLSGIAYGGVFTLEKIECDDEGGGHDHQHN
jgi:hypothetical protein